MAQLIIKNIEDDVHDKLKALASSHNHSMEEEVRNILRRAVMVSEEKSKLGTQIASRFKDHSLESNLSEMKDQETRLTEYFWSRV